MGLDITLLATRKINVFDTHITHNLTDMAQEVKIGDNILYDYLWKPDELDINRAIELIEPLGKAIQELKSNPDYYKQFDSSNGWGVYDDFISFIEEYLEACIKNSDGELYVSV